MKYDLLILGVDFLLLLLCILTFYKKLKKGGNLFYLIASCSIVWGFISGFLYAFPLDEGIVPENQVATYERGAAVSSALLGLNAIFLIILILKRYRIRRGSL
jgi:uncharacterized membrane protein